MKKDYGGKIKLINGVMFVKRIFDAKRQKRKQERALIRIILLLFLLCIMLILVKDTHFANQYITVLFYLDIYKKKVSKIETVIILCKQNKNQNNVAHYEK